MTDREAFEAWWIPLNYKQVSENIAWLAWQAALASERAKQAEPVTMSMFATRADYDAAVKKQAEPVETGCVGPVDRKRPCGKCGALPGEPCPLYAAPPADDELMRTRSLNAELNNARAAVADQRDEAVRLLKKAMDDLQDWTEVESEAPETLKCIAEINAYLARVTK